MPVCLVIAGTLVYLNTLGNPFVFDSVAWIVGKDRVHSLSNIGQMLSQSNRPVLEITLAINYTLGGENPAGYHLFNLAVHLLAGLVLYGLVRRTIQLPCFSEALRARANWLAGAVALIWLVHPLNTQSVTYVIQRGESLMGLCYLLTLYCFVRYATGGGKLYAVFAVLACWIGVGCKEVIATAPLVVLIYDFTFIRDSVKQTLRKRWAIYLGLFAMWLPLAVILVRGLGGDDASAGLALEGKLLSRWTYLLTQPGVILEVYLRKAFWPSPLVLDYMWPPAIPQDTPSDQVMHLFISRVLFQGLIVTGLFFTAVIGVIRKTWWGFVLACFFLILAPTSSIMPIADLAVEHRMYLPLICVVLIVVVMVDQLIRRASPQMAWKLEALLVSVVVIVLGLQTFVRNVDYRSNVAIWDATVIARPNNPRAWHNLGSALNDSGEPDQAMFCYEKVLELVPQYHEAQFGIGGIWLDRGNMDKAIERFSAAVELKPDDASYQAHLGQAYMLNQQFDKAEQCLEKAIELDPQYARAYESMGLLSLARQDIDGAIDAFRKAVEVDPEQMASRRNLAAALNDAGQTAEAIQVLNEAIDYAQSTHKPEALIADLMNRRSRYQGLTSPAPVGP